jgi:ParB family transcriptional regulator, chromosome partitioning protein
MMTAQAEKIAEKTDSGQAVATVGKVPEKHAEKRRALGRGLESLLPGPRVVKQPSAPEAPTAPAGEGGGAPSASSGQALATASAAALQSATIHELQAEAEIAPTTSEGLPVAEIPIAEIDYNPYQTRTHYDDNQLNELAASIKVQGVIQPVVVRPATPPYHTSEDGTPLRYILILGQRRIMASRRAGKTAIPAVVKRVSEQQAAEMTLIENLQRQDLNCMDQAAAFRQLSEKFRLTQEEIGHRVGVSRETVSNHMRLLRLPERAAGYLNEGKLSFSHARQLLVIEDKLTLGRVAEKAVREKLSVEKLEELIAEMLGGAPGENADQKKSTGARWVDPNVRAQQRNLESTLGMKVRIRDRKGKGTIRIEYSSLDDFDRLVGLLKGKKQ